MAQYRADFTVLCSLVLSDELRTATLRTRGDQSFTVTFVNAELDASGHVPSLEATVVGEGNDIHDVAYSFRAVLADHLDVLSFVTQGSFTIDQCIRVIAWEPFQKSRRMLAYGQFDPLKPPSPELRTDFLATAQALLDSDPRDYVRRAIHSFRLGLIERQTEDQFRHFWSAIEIVAEGSKETQRRPVSCQKCEAAMECQACGHKQMMRPMATQTIREMIAALGVPDASGIAKQLIDTRHGLTHGRSSPYSDLETLSDLVHKAGFIAWHLIHRALPGFNEAERVFGYREQGFSNGNLIASADLELGTEHDSSGFPPTTGLPRPTVELITRFGPPVSGEKA